MKSTSSTSLGGESLDATRLNSILACPNCVADLELPNATSAVCSSCATKFRRLPHAWQLFPPRELWSSELWATWEQLQANGIAGYEADPDRNLGVGERDDCRSFSRFCGLSGLVLDVGCGPQAWPAYFDPHEKGTRFAGVDPLVGQNAASYTQVRGLGEHLPFRSETFDQVLFATTLDHFVDPVQALREAARVLRQDGRINIWLGHKSRHAPRPARSADWYRELTVPDGADDLFHVRRLDPVGARELFSAASLELAAEEIHEVDSHRSNHFHSLFDTSRR